MMNDQLVGYIRAQLLAGVAREEIHKAAVAAQWMPADIDAAFAAIEGAPTAPSVVVPPPPVFSPEPMSASVPPVMTPSMTIAEAQPRRSFLVPALIAGAVLVVAGGGAYAYFAQMGPFSASQYAENTFLSSILMKSLEIKNASYTATVSLAVNPREEDATPFVAPPVNEALETQYKRDAGQINTLGSMVSDLKYKYGDQRTYDYTKKTYVTKAGKPFPAALSSADMKSLSYRTSSGDLVTDLPYTYAATEGGKNFTVTTTLETNEAVNAIRKSYNYTATGTPIVGKKVTFTKDSYVYIPSKLPKPFLVELAEMMRQIPPDVSGDISFAAVTDFSAEGIPDWRFNLTANGDLGDLTYAIDVEALRKDKNYYIRVNKLPSLFGDLASYKGQWFVISPSAASSTARGYGSDFSYIARSISETEVAYKEQRAATVEVGKKVNQLAEKHRLFTFKTQPKKENVEGQTLYRYQLDIRKEAIIPFVKDVVEETKNDRAFSFLNDPGLLSYLESEDFDTTFAYLKHNVFYTVWTDRDGFPAVLEYRMRVVPPDTAMQLKGKQIDLTFKLNLAEINKGVNIEAPKDAKPIEKVIEEMSKNKNSSSLF
ncbi:MAG: hypothetical protein AAB442_00010 [Patescibacteria group bacterium]